VTCTHGYSMVLVFALTLLLVASAGHADVTIKQNVRLEGVGAMKLMNMTTQSTTYLSKDSSRTESNTRMDSGLMRMFAGSGAYTQIVRLDLGTIYQLNPKKKRFKEISLAARREEMEKSMAQMRKAEASRQRTASGIDESQCEWSEPRTQVVKSRDPFDIAGFSARRLTATASQSCTDKRNPTRACEFRLVLDQWRTTNFPGAAEVLAYYRGYARKMGLDLTSSSVFAQRAESMFGQYPAMWRKVAAEMNDVKGYPVKASFSLEIGGPQCGSAAEATQTEQSPSTSASIGRTLAGGVGAAIGGLFGHKKPKPEAEPSQTATTGSDDGFATLLTISSEVTSAKQGPVNAEMYEVPAGFKKSG
jgi:hypothetical protein